MKTFWRGAAAVLIGLTILGGGAIGALAQEDEDSDDAQEVAVAPGTLDDGASLLPQAEISIAEAVQAAQSAASGPVGEVDLEYYRGHLVFNVDVGDQDVKVDASDGSVLASVADD